MPSTIWTIGHSNHAIEQFVEMLQAHKIALVADVRRFPGSRRQPQFGGEQLEASLAANGIGYRHLPGLGGRRSARAENSPNSAWRVESFNAYADHMATDEFCDALGELKAAARKQSTAIMCSEAVPWRCHRRLIADALVVEGWTVLDILSTRPAKEHKLTDFAQVAGGQVIYPGLFPAGE